MPDLDPCDSKTIGEPKSIAQLPYRWRADFCDEALFAELQVAFRA